MKYTHKSQTEKGRIRIAKYHQLWRGFNLLPGHMFGEFAHSLTWYRNGYQPDKGRVRIKTASRYWVTGLETGVTNGSTQKVRVYLCEETPDEYRWHSYWVDSSSKLLEPMYAAISERIALGFDGVQTTPLEQQHVSIPTRLTTPAYTQRGVPSHNSGTLRENYWNCTLTQVPGHKGTEEAHWAEYKSANAAHNRKVASNARAAAKYAGK